MKTKMTLFLALVSMSVFVLSACGGGGDDSLLTCGDGVIDTELGETCDDGNTDDGDDCPADCILVSVSDICGDGVQGTTEECDDANIALEDGCSDVCKVEYCGDGTMQAGLGEACDDGNLTSNDGCSSICQADTVVTLVTTETLCSDGLDDDGDGTVDCADTDCAADAACVVVAAETLCSDGLDDDGDGTIDCADTDCAADTACSVTDTDGDGTPDSSDTEADETSCADDFDNDGDGSTDCYDSDCSETVVCGGSASIGPSMGEHHEFSDGPLALASVYNTSAVFFKGMHFETSDGESREITSIGAYLDSVTSSVDADGALSLSSTVVENTALGPQTDDKKQRDLDVWYRAAEADRSAIGFYHGTKTGSTEDSATVTGTSITVTDFNSNDVAYSDSYDYYLIVLRGFNIEYTDADESRQFQKLKVKVYWKSNDSKPGIGVPSDGNLEPKFEIESHSASGTSFNYDIYYTVIGIDSSRVAYGFDLPSSYQMKPYDAESKEKDVDITMSQSISDPEVLSMLSGFEIRAYDQGEGEYLDEKGWLADKDREVIKMSFYIASTSGGGSTITVGLQSSVNLNDAEMGAGVKMDTVVLASPSTYMKAANGSLSLEKEKSKQTQTVTCSEADSVWSCE